MLTRCLTQVRKESDNPIALATEIARISSESRTRLIEICCVFFVGPGLARRNISQPCYPT